MMIKTSPIVVMARLAFVATCVFLITACDPFENRRAEHAERTRMECLDKFCTGDVEPKHDMANEEALKLNGQWYIGPREYFSTGKNGGGFYWPSRHPMFKGGEYPEGGQDFPAKAIEIFLSSKSDPPVARSTYQLLLSEEYQGHVIEKQKLRDGLEVWRTRDGIADENWYIATHLRDPSGDPAVVACRGSDAATGQCSMGLSWRPDVAARLRFRATHGPDWPEIFLETTRVLQLLRKS